MNKPGLLLMLAVAIVIVLSKCKKEEKKAELPTINTLAVAEITVNSAKSGGNVTQDGGGDIVSRGVVWSVLQNPSLELHTGKTSDGSGPGTFQSSITGLASNTSYFVRAYASNSAGVAYGNELQFVTGSLPQADFIATPASGTAPLMVSFTDQSTSNPTQWQWSFGDGNTSALQNPAHTCENAGSYSVQLTVSNGYGSDTETKNDYIIVNDFICGSSTLRWLCLYPAIFLLFIAAPGTTCVHN